MAFLPKLVLYTLLSILARRPAAQNTWVNINNSPGFQILPQCAGLCLQDPATYVDVRSGIGCPAVPFGQNECYCRADLKPAASSYISSCVLASCGPNTTNVVNAISVSNAYCLTAPGADEAVPTTTTSNGASSTAGAAQSIWTASAPLTGANSVPSLVLEPISYGPPTVPPPHSSIPAYTGSGSLLQGYCNTPHYVLLDGPTAYWAPMVGCNNDKTDCCPYPVAQQSSAALVTGVTVTVISTVTVNFGTGPTQVAYTGLNAYPAPLSVDEASLQGCPNDYQTVSGGCCPSGYQLWNAVLGGQVPCYSSLDNNLSPPAVPIANYQTPISAPALFNTSAGTPTTSSTSSGSSTFAVLNVVYAVPYPLVLAPAQGLSTAAKAGIGVSSSIAGIAIIALAFLLIRRIRNSHGAYMPSPAPGPETTSNHNQNVMSSMSPSRYVQAPGSSEPQGIHSLPPQMQQMHQMQQGQAQVPVQYPSQYPSSAPLQPPLDAEYSNQGGYSPPGFASAYAPPSSGSQGPTPEGYGYQPNYGRAAVTRRPVPASPTS